MTDRIDRSADRYTVAVTSTAENSPHSFALQMIGAGRSVLEIGCAAGHVTEQLVAAGNEVVGVELDSAAAARAERFARRVHRLDLDRDRITEFEHDEFDVLLAGDVLEHLRDSLATLTDALQLLRPDGEVIISVPNAAHADVRLHLLEGRFEYASEGLLDHTHMRWFTRASLREMLAEAGLTAVELRRVVCPVGGSNVGVDLSIHSRAVVDFVTADPDHDTFQFVVRCQRTAGGCEDALAALQHEWPRHSCDEVDELRLYAKNLRAALDLWETSRHAKLRNLQRRWLDRIRTVAQGRKASAEHLRGDRSDA